MGLGLRPAACHNLQADILPTNSQPSPYLCFEVAASRRETSGSSANGHGQELHLARRVLRHGSWTTKGLGVGETQYCFEDEAVDFLKEILSSFVFSVPLDGDSN